MGKGKSVADGKDSCSSSSTTPVSKPSGHAAQPNSKQTTNYASPEEDTAELNVAAQLAGLGLVHAKGVVVESPAT